MEALSKLALPVVAAAAAAMWFAGCNLSLKCTDDTNCPAGQWCDTTTHWCVSYARSDGGVDSGTQPHDAGATDAGPTDLDAGVTDGGLVDGGALPTYLEANTGAGSMSTPADHAIVRGRLGATGVLVGPSHSIKGGITP